MKIYSYWVVERSQVTVSGQTQEIRSYGGSDVSEADASDKAKIKLEKLKRKIAGEQEHSVHQDDYVVEIREEIVTKLDDKAVITRNRYGAQVLNVSQMMILDIDYPKDSFWDLFRGKRAVSGQDKIIEQVRRLCSKNKYANMCFRIYRTCKGVRVIVLGQAFDPKSQQTLSMMRDFNCDPLYMLLCHKQACFRARLTPKPFRIKVPKLPIGFPRNDDEQQAFQQWLSGYESASQYYSVCQFVEQIGLGELSVAVQLHDQMTGAHVSLPLK